MASFLCNRMRFLPAACGGGGADECRCLEQRSLCSEPWFLWAVILPLFLETAHWLRNWRPVLVWTSVLSEAGGTCPSHLHLALLLENRRDKRRDKKMCFRESARFRFDDTCGSAL